MIHTLNEVKQKRQEKKSILLEGLTPGMSVHYANCCNPIPGDQLRLYFRRKRSYDSRRYL